MAQNYAYLKYAAANNSTVTIPKGKQNIRIKNSNGSTGNINVLSYSYDYDTKVSALQSTTPLETKVSTLQSTTPLEVGDTLFLGSEFMNYGKIEVISTSVADTAHVNYI